MDAKYSRIFTDEQLDVSIHAPVMDANACVCYIVLTVSVSIHAPVMDAKAPSLSR